MLASGIQLILELFARLASKCPKKVVLVDFNFDNDNAGFPGGLFVEQAGTVSENLRGYYRKEPEVTTFLSDYCLWWHRPYHHWWIGHCRNRGDNNGLAWLEPDVLCPHEAKSGEWRRGGSDTVMAGFVREAKASDLNATTTKIDLEEGALAKMSLQKL